MIPLLLADLSSGTLDYQDRDGGGSMTGVGALRFRDGGALVEEAGTNLFRNPAANTGTHAAIPRLSAVVTQGVKQGITGQDGFAITTPGAATGEGVNWQMDAAMGTTSARTFVASLSLTDLSGQLAVNVLTFCRYDDATFDSATSPPLTINPSGDPQRLVAPALTVNAAKTLDYVAASVRTASAQARTFVASGLQIEEQPYATTPCPQLDASANLLPGYAWTDVAHNSASTRAAASILAPCDPPGWVAVRYSEDFGQTWDTAILDGVGPVGDYGQVSHDGDNLVLTSDRATIYGQLMAGNGELTPEQQARLVDAEGDWTWDMFLPRFGGIHVSVPIEPIAVAVSVPVTETGG